jgi:carbonic anhydrase/acetyltransferase-like protein (isoleucine patch superfamily)
VRVAHGPGPLARAPTLTPVAASPALTTCAHPPSPPLPSPICRHPWADPSVFVAPNATVVGRVDLNQHASVWYGAVVRGDLNDVAVGAYSSIGDRAVVHTTKSVEGHVSAGTVIGNYVVVEAGALLQSCTVGDHAVIGAGAVVMEGALVEAHAVVGAGAVVHPGRRIPSGQRWEGNPAVYVRDVDKAELATAQSHAEVRACVQSARACMWWSRVRRRGRACAGTCGGWGRCAPSQLAGGGGWRRWRGGCLISRRACRPPCATLTPVPLPPPRIPFRHAPQDIAASASEHAYEFLPANTAYLAAEKTGVVDAAVQAINAQQAAYEAAVKQQA